MGEGGAEGPSWKVLVEYGRLSEIRSEWRIHEQSRGFASYFRPRFRRPDNRGLLGTARRGYFDAWRTRWNPGARH